MTFYLNDIYTLFLIFSTLAFAALIFLDKNRFALLLEYGINQKYAQLYHRKDSIIYSVFISLNTVIILSILTSFYVFSINNGIMSLFIFIKIAILLTGFYLIKIIVNHCLGIIFEHLYVSKKYYYSYSTNLLFLSIISFPLILFISYYKNGLIILDNAQYVYAFYLCIYFILKIILLKRLNLFQIPFIFYNILYLCALELAPYLGLLELLQLIY